MVKSTIDNIATIIKCKIEILKILNEHGRSEYSRGKMDGYLEILNSIIPNIHGYNDWFEYINEVEEYVDNL